MPRLVVTEGAVRRLELCRQFLKEKNPVASSRASEVIRQHFKSLAENPQIGRPLEDSPEIRELVIPFGSTGYVALYRYDKSENVVFILAFRHQREAGY